MKISYQRNSDAMTVSLRGDINESCEEEFRELPGRLEVPEVIFETEKVELINSLGARYWISMIQSLTRRTQKITFRKCSPAFVDSCNIYPKFVPKGSIESLFVIADCSACGDQQQVLLSREQCLAQDPLADARCPRCSGGLESSLDFDEYLQCMRDN